MSSFIIFLSFFLFISTAGILLFLFPAKKRNRSIKQKTPPKHPNNPNLKNNSENYLLTPPEREEMLENVRNITRSNPKKAAHLLRKWIDDDLHE
ncbi:MAG: hypothetical protein OEZ34_01505 [Spirochaetia bacterium]|nr:hypothetical protein [Spirochaetia bacterium]